MSKYVTAEEAVKVVKSGDRVYLQAAAASPTVLSKALTARASELINVEICHLHTEGEAPYANPELAKSFHVNSFFLGANVRHTLKAGNGSYTPVFLSELPVLFRKNVLPLDVVFIHVSPPDRHGYCSLGVSVEASVAAIENAKIVVAQVNPNMPRTFGDGILHESEIDYLVAVNEPIFAHGIDTFTPEEEKIGEYVASLIEDRSGYWFHSECCLKQITQS
jgi:acyl-CoA hydrolase